MLTPCCLLGPSENLREWVYDGIVVGYEARLKHLLVLNSDFMHLKLLLHRIEDVGPD